MTDPTIKPEDNLLVFMKPMTHKNFLSFGILLKSVCLNTANSSWSFTPTPESKHLNTSLKLYRYSWLGLNALCTTQGMQSNKNRFMFRQSQRHNSELCLLSVMVTEYSSHIAVPTQFYASVLMYTAILPKSRSLQPHSCRVLLGAKC